MSSNDTTTAGSSKTDNNDDNNNNNIKLIIDLFQSVKRQGPGGDRETKLALELSGILSSTPTSTTTTAAATEYFTSNNSESSRCWLWNGSSNCDVSRKHFLEKQPKLRPSIYRKIFFRRYKQQPALKDNTNITTLAASMDDLPFEEDSLDMIWSEGAIYNIGFEKGIKLWRKFLKTGRGEF